MNWNISSGSHQRAQPSRFDFQAPKTLKTTNNCNARIDRVRTNALAYLTQSPAKNTSKAIESNRLRFKSAQRSPNTGVASNAELNEIKPTLNPLFSRTFSPTSPYLVNWSSNQPQIHKNADTIFRLLPTSVNSSKLAPNPKTANRLEINNRLIALQDSCKRMGLEESKKLNFALSGQSTVVLLKEIQNLQNKNRVLMRMAPPDSQQNGRVAFRIEREYERNKKVILPLQREILLRLKLDDGQLTPLMTAVFDNANPQKFSLDTQRQTRFPAIPTEWNIDDPSTLRFEQFKVRANGLINQLNYAYFTDPSFCAHKETEAQKLRQLSRMSAAQIVNSTNMPALRALLMQSKSNLVNARELSQLIVELNPKRSIADSEAFAHYKAMGFFAAKISKQLDHIQAKENPQQILSSNLLTTTNHLATAQWSPSKPKIINASHPFSATHVANNSNLMKRIQFTAQSINTHSKPINPLTLENRLIEQTLSPQQDHIARLRRNLHIDSFEQNKEVEMTKIFEERFSLIKKRNDLSAANGELELAKKERRDLQMLIQSMRSAGETPGDLEQRAFRFYYYKAQAAEGLQLELNVD